MLVRCKRRAKDVSESCSRPSERHTLLESSLDVFCIYPQTMLARYLGLKGSRTDVSERADGSRTERSSRIGHVQEHEG
jgi:hypothetical protein